MEIKTLHDDEVWPASYNTHENGIQQVITLWYELMLLSQEGYYSSYKLLPDCA